MVLSDSNITVLTVAISLHATHGRAALPLLGFDAAETISPQLFGFTVGVFKTDELEAEWHALPAADRADQIEAFEVLTVRLYQPGPKLSAFQSARMTAAYFLMDLFGVTGFPSGWTLYQDPLEALRDGNQASTPPWTPNTLLEHRWTLSHMLRRARSRPTATSLSLLVGVDTNVVADRAFPSPLPWIFSAYQDPWDSIAAFPEGNARGDDAALHEFRCAVDPRSVRPERAHILPRTLSRRDFNLNLAELRRYLCSISTGPQDSHVNAAFREMLFQLESAFRDEATSDPTSQRITSSVDNNMLLLAPDLHRALDNHHLYVSVFDDMPIWLGGYTAPSIVDRAERNGGYPFLSEYLDAPNTYRRPALYVNGLRTLFEKCGTTQLKDAYRRRALELWRRTFGDEGLGGDAPVGPHVSTSLATHPLPRPLSAHTPPRCDEPVEASSAESRKRRRASTPIPEPVRPPAAVAAAAAERGARSADEMRFSTRADFDRCWVNTAGTCRPQPAGRLSREATRMIAAIGGRLGGDGDGDGDGDARRTFRWLQRSAADSAPPNRREFAQLCRAAGYGRDAEVAQVRRALCVDELGHLCASVRLSGDAEGGDDEEVFDIDRYQELRNAYMDAIFFTAWPHVIGAE